MQSNKTLNNNLYDQFFLEQTFDTKELKEHAQSDIDWIIGETNIPKNSNVLDVACGTGRHLLAFLKHGYSPYGVDLSTDCVRLAKKNCPTISERIYEDDFLSFSNKISIDFDLITIAGASFGYDVSYEASINYIDNLLKILKKDGFLFIQFINKNWAENKFKNITTFWTENESFFILDKRIFKDNKLMSEKIYINKISKDVKKYSDSVFVFSAAELLSYVSAKYNLKSDIKIMNNFSNSLFVESASAMPVLIIKK